MSTRPQALQFVGVGDAIQCDMRFPYPHTVTMTLVTREAAAFANELLTDPARGWRIARLTGEHGDKAADPAKQRSPN